MKLIFWPYKMGSLSCKLLARELSALRVYPNRHYKPEQHHMLINWGNSNLVRVNWNIHRAGHVLNKPQAVSKASNKLSTLQSLQGAGVGIPPWCTGGMVADILRFPIYCRTTLTGKGGDGIIVANEESELVYAPLYTQGVRVAREFRVHVFNDNIIDFTEKKKRRGVEHNEQIRNFKNGWVFCRQGIVLPDIVEEHAIRAIQALDLDFGAVDICITADNEPIVFEVNTAPGVEGSTLQAYTQAIKELCHGAS